jgi:hypothetical protein
MYIYSWLDWIIYTLVIHTEIQDSFTSGLLPHGPNMCKGLYQMRFDVHSDLLSYNLRKSVQ